jgi:hypothetical protein
MGMKEADLICAKPPLSGPDQGRIPIQRSTDVMDRNSANLLWDIRTANAKIEMQN